jgi:hypothetical protein
VPAIVPAKLWPATLRILDPVEAERRLLLLAPCLGRRRIAERLGRRGAETMSRSAALDVTEGSSITHGRRWLRLLLAH